MGALLADRAEEKPGEPAATARADDEEIRRGGSMEEGLGRLRLDHVALEPNSRIVPAEGFCQRLVEQAFAFVPQVVRDFGKQEGRWFQAHDR